MMSRATVASVLLWTVTVSAPAYAIAGGHLTQLSFEPGSSTVNPGALPEVSSVTGPCTRSTATCASGLGCYRWNPAAQVCNATKPFTGSSVVRAFARIRVSAFPSGSFGHDFFSLNEPFYGTGVFVGFVNTNQLQVTTFGSGGASDTCGPLATPVASNTWYGIRLRAKKSDTSTISLDLLDDNGVMLDTVTCVNQRAGGGSFSLARVGSANGFGATADITIDDVDIHNDSGWPGNVRWTYLQPTSNASCGYTPTGCSAGNQWDCVDESPPSDGSATSLSSSTTSACTFNHPTAAAKGIDNPIHATLLWWNAKATAGTPTLSGRLGTNDVGAQLLTATDANYFALNLTNPSNGLAWTAANLNSLAFGVRKTTAGTVSVSATQLLVGYEDAPPPPTPTPTPALYSAGPSFANPTPGSGDAFGTSVATAGGYVIIGAPSKSRVYVYDHISGALRLTLQNPHPSANDQFGAAVAGEGKNIVVGAPLDDNDGVDAGAVYMFDGITGALLKTFHNPHPGSTGLPDSFGSAVAVVAVDIVVGAEGEDLNGADAGAVYVFDQGPPAQANGVLALTLVKPAPVGTSDFGAAVGANGTQILVGDPADSAVAAGAGAVYVFDGNDFFNANYGALDPPILRKPTPAANDQFGTSVAGGFVPLGGFSGLSLILVGTPGDDQAGVDAGAALVFNAETGTHLKTLTGPAAGDQFGTSVASVRGTHLLVGAPYHDSGGTNTGSAYLYDLANNYVLARTFTNPDPQNQDLFGAAVSGGRHALIGAPQDSSAALNSGGAYLFERGTPYCANSQPTALIGAWSPAVAHPAASVHTILTSENTVLFFQGADVWYQSTPTFVWDVATGAVREQALPAGNSGNLFCAGHAPLADGRIMVIGGTAVLTNGIATSYAFDPTAESWAFLSNMEYPRWYPTATVLRDGRLMATQGTDPEANTPEVYDPANNTWTTLNEMTAAKNMALYPFMFLLPNGKVLYAGGPDNDGPGDSEFETAVLDLATQSWTTLTTNAPPGGSAAMYAPGKILKSGGESRIGNVIGNSASVLDMTVGSPAWRSVEAMDFPRSHHTLVILPDGKVVSVGGATAADDPVNAVMAPEMWDPATEQWDRVACMPMPRMYHSGAVLLPDGRVLSQGGNDYPSYQLYSPPYLYRGPRPTIATVPNSISYDTTFNLDSPDAASITAVVLMRTGAATHAFDQNQRRVPVSFTRSGNTLTVTAPTSADTAPPGDYMLFILNGDAVPSIASFVNLGGVDGCQISPRPSRRIGWWHLLPLAALLVVRARHRRSGRQA